MAHMLGLIGNSVHSSSLSLALPLVSQRCEADSEGRPQCAEPPEANELQELLPRGARRAVRPSGNAASIPWIGRNLSRLLESRRKIGELGNAHTAGQRESTTGIPLYRCAQMWTRVRCAPSQMWTRVRCAPSQRWTRARCAPQQRPRVRYAHAGARAGEERRKLKNSAGSTLSPEDGQAKFLGLSLWPIGAGCNYTRAEPRRNPAWHYPSIILVSDVGVLDPPATVSGVPEWFADGVSCTVGDSLGGVQCGGPVQAVSSEASSESFSPFSLLNGGIQVEAECGELGVIFDTEPISRV